MRFSVLTLGTLVASLLFSQGIAFASIFRDIPDGHMYQGPIEKLVGLRIINGNPDGTFVPDRTVNRAEMLKMLYIAAGITPDPSSVRCFPDVEVGGWYEMYVCDATSRRYVQGYANGDFLPGNPVNRVEALKMIMEVLGITVDEISPEQKDIVNFVDVSTSAWYTKYLLSAFSKGVLPIAGQTGSRFYPEWPLLRGEAAAYIFNALYVDLTETRKEIEQATMQDDETDTPPASPPPPPPATAPPPSVMETNFPLSQSGKFDKRKSQSYRFDITSPMTVRTVVSLQSGQPGEVSCRLYLLNDSGFSDQYHLGYQEGNKCYLTTSLSAGLYQLQVQPTSPDTTFIVDSMQGTGDGNDGFSEAKSIQSGTLRTGNIAPGDFEDWFTFTVSSETTYEVEMSNSANLRCIVYAMSDVDLYGFTGPECNRSYIYPPGTYYVAVGRQLQKGANQTYTMRLIKR